MNECPWATWWKLRSSSKRRLYLLQGWNCNRVSRLSRFVTFQMLLPLAITNCGRLRDNLITLSNEGALRSRRHPRYCLPVGSKQMTIMYGVLTQCFNVTILYYIYKCLKWEFVVLNDKQFYKYITYTGNPCLTNSDIKHLYYIIGNPCLTNTETNSYYI